MKRRVWLQLVVPLLSLCVLFLLLAGEPGKTQTRRELTQISVIPREVDGTLWATARQGMEQAAADMGAELRFLTISETNRTLDQQELLDRETESGAEAVVLFPADRTALEDSVQAAAVRAEIITMDTDMTESGAAACIRVDNSALGTDIATAALNGVPEGGMVLLMNCSPGSNGAGERMSAAARVLRQEGRRVEFLELGRPELATEQLPKVLERLRPDAVMAFETGALETAADVIRSVSPRPLLYGMGSTGAIAAHLEQSDITLIAARNEFASGYLAIQAAVRAVGGLERPEAENLAYAMVRRENMYRPENEKLLFPVTR